MNSPEQSTYEIATDRAVYMKVDHDGAPIHIWKEGNNEPLIKKQAIDSQYQLWQLLVDEETHDQIKIAATIAQNMKLIPQEDIEKILQHPFHSSCIDKDKKDKDGHEVSHLAIGGAGIGWKAAMIALIRKEFATLPTPAIHSLVSNVVNTLDGFSYHTDDVDHICSHDDGDNHIDSHKTKKKKHGCTHRWLLQTDPLAYGITEEDSTYLENVKYPENGHSKNIKRSVIQRSPEDDYTVVVLDYDDTTESNTSRFYSMPNTVNVDGKTYKCYDYSRDIAHMVIRDKIIPTLLQELHAMNIHLPTGLSNDMGPHPISDEIATKVKESTGSLPVNNWHYILTNSLQKIVDHHTQLTINKATHGKKTIHIVPIGKLSSSTI